MTSITDVFDQLVTANNTLGQIHGDIQAETAEIQTVNTSVQDVKTSVDQLDGDVKAGFDATVNALGTIAQIETEAAKLIFHLTQQADAMICELEHISRNTCGILNEAVVQTRLQTQLADDVAEIRYVTDTAHPDAVLERSREDALRAQIERCCPPEPPQPPCTYEPCPHPDPAKPPRLPDRPKRSPNG
jgi:hypothetical protein